MQSHVNELLLVSPFYIGKKKIQGCEKLINFHGTIVLVLYHWHSDLIPEMVLSVIVLLFLHK